MDLFHLSYDENYDNICGQILLTNKGRLAFFCTFCGQYRNYEEFITHLLEKCFEFVNHDNSEKCITRTSLTGSTSALFASLPKGCQIFQEESIDANLLVNLNSTSEKQSQCEVKILVPSIQTKLSQSQVQLGDFALEESITALDQIELNEECTSSDFESFEGLNNPANKKNNSNTLTEKSESTTAPRNANEGSSIENSKEAVPANANELSSIENGKEAAQRNDDSKDMETKMELDDLINIPVVVRDVGKIEFYRSHIAPEERKFKCPICGLSFKDRHNRNKHMQRHTNEKDFSCSHCSKKFYTSSETKTHYKLVHEKPDKRFLCTECGKGFVTAYGLKRHQRRHNNQRDFVCEICNKAFFDYAHLKKHLISHSSKRPFMCETCGASFKARNTWHTHMKIHQNQRAYKCQFCEASFNVSSALRGHIKSKHE